jgi:hypothetical protein
MGAIDTSSSRWGSRYPAQRARDAVALLTSDARMARAARRAGNDTRTAADRLNLPARAEDLGYRWRPEP